MAASAEHSHSLIIGEAMGHASFPAFRIAGVILAAAILITCPSRAVDLWTKAVGNSSMPLGDGFGAGLSNHVVESLEVFNGSVYAGVGQYGVADGNVVSVWKSGDLMHWMQVNVTPTNAAIDVLFMTHSADAIFFGTENGPGQIWRSTDGNAWAQFNGSGSGWNPGHSVGIAALANDGTNLYAATGTISGNGGQIWKRPLDSSSAWIKIYTLPAGVVGTWLYEACINGTNTLFATTSAFPITDPSQGWLYESRDGGNLWTTNPGVGSGFGNANNLNLAWVVAFNGYLYGGVHNPSQGSELWRVSLTNVDGTWGEVSQAHNGFGAGAGNAELHRAAVAGGFLWVTTLSQVGSQVWRSGDGTNWVQSNITGFNSTNMVTQMDALAGFGNELVWGGGSPTTGAQIWELGPIVTNPVLQIQATGSVVLIFWPVGALDFNLEATTNLIIPAWTAVTNSPASTNGWNSTPVGTASGSRFFVEAAAPPLRGCQKKHAKHATGLAGQIGIRFINEVHAVFSTYARASGPTDDQAGLDRAHRARTRCGRNSGRWPHSAMEEDRRSG